MDIILFEDYNQDDEYETFTKSLDECITQCNQCLQEYSEQQDYEDIITSTEDLLVIAPGVKDLIDLNSKLVVNQCQILKLALNNCLQAVKQLDDEVALNLTEAIKRCLIDCEQQLN